MVCFCSGSSTRTDSCATPSPAHSGTHTHNPKPQQKPTPSSSSPFIGQYYVTSSCYSLPFRVHFLCRCTRSSQSSTSPSPFRTLPQVPPPFLSLSMPPPFCPLLSQRPKAVKSDLVVRFQFSRKARYSSSATQTKTESCKKRSRRKVSVQPQGSLLLLSHPNKNKLRQKCKRSYAQFEPYQPSSLLTANLPYTFLKYPPPFPPSPPFSYSCSSHPIFSSFSSFSSSSFSASSVSSPSPSYSSESKIKNKILP